MDRMAAHPSNGTVTISIILYLIIPMHYHLDKLVRSRCFVQGRLLIKIVKSNVEVVKEERRESIGESEGAGESPPGDVIANWSLRTKRFQSTLLPPCAPSPSLVYSLLHRVVVCQLDFSSL
jgi:hypothetical protein